MELPGEVPLKHFVDLKNAPVVYNTLFIAASAHFDSLSLWLFVFVTSTQFFFFLKNLKALKIVISQFGKYTENLICSDWAGPLLSLMLTMLFRCIQNDCILSQHEAVAKHPRQGEHVKPDLVCDKPWLIPERLSVPEGPQLFSTSLSALTCNSESITTISESFGRTWLVPGELTAHLSSMEHGKTERLGIRTRRSV